MEKKFKEIYVYKWEREREREERRFKECAKDTKK